MRKLFFTLLILLAFNIPVFSSVFQGGVEKESILSSNRILDSVTRAPISGAKISIPQDGYSTYTDSNGKFSLDTSIDGQTVLSIEKSGYKPYSLTIDSNSSSKPIVIGIEKSTPRDITIDTNMFHLGDNSYSDLSANSRDFQVKAIGPYYSKKFKIPTIAPGGSVNLVIGSIMGIDTLMAKSMGQNKINTAYASPPEVIFNGNKIASIQLNGDGEKIRLPYRLIRQNQLNEITIKTGRNMMQTAYVDYDDIEFMNLSIDIR